MAVYCFYVVLYITSRTLIYKLRANSVLVSLEIARFNEKRYFSRFRKFIAEGRTI